VSAAVTSVLEIVGRPMQVCEVDAAVERLLGRPVSYSSVKEGLSSHSRGGDQRFRRIRRGWYEFPPDLTGTNIGCIKSGETQSLEGG